MNPIVALLTRLFKGGSPPPAQSAMQEAMREARESLPAFWDWLEDNQETEAHRALKVGFDTRRGSVEYIWLTDVRRTAFFVSGIVSDRPWDVPDLKEGEICPINLDKIVDWTFQQDGLFYGQFTSRIMAASDPSMAAGLMALSGNPLPSVPVRH